MASRSTADCFSFNPPGDSVDASRRPPSILLGQHAYVVVSRNETTATAKSRDDHTVEVTFWIADPPAVSFFTIHCSKPPLSDSEDADIEVEPHVVGAEGRFVLILTRFASGDGEDEYFLYKGDAKSPSLESVPLPDNDSLDAVREFSIVPRGDGGHYLLVALCGASWRASHYQLSIYSSEDRAWRTEELPNPCSGVNTILAEKVITLGEGILGWVDFFGGMLVCDLRQIPPVACHIPWPMPLPGNRQNLDLFPSTARCFRDVTCTNGVVKFIEIEHRVIVQQESTEIAPDTLTDPSCKDVLYDSELIIRENREDMNIKPKKKCLMNGWRAVTWTREIDSNCWLRGRIVDVDDIVVDDSTYSVLLSGQRDKSLGGLKFRDMYSAWPMLSIDGDDLLYLNSRLKLTGRDGWMVAVDLAKKTLKVEARGIGANSLGKYVPSMQMCRPCTLSNYLNMIPGIKVPAFCQITQVGSSANDSINKAIHVGEPDSCKSNKRPRLTKEKVNHAQNGAQCIAPNVHVSPVRPHQIKLLPQPRINRRPSENNLLPQQCFNNRDGPSNPGYAPLAPAPQRCFNNWDGSSNPGYTPLAPARNLHSYGNYQPLLQQPPPSYQQLTPSSGFGPHQAPQPCFNNWNGANYHGYSQQLPAHNPYAYVHYQQQWREHRPVQELRAHAASQQPPPRNASADT